MIQINLNLNLEQVQDIISNRGANSLAKQMLTTIFNQLMEKERDDYVQVDTNFREEHRNSSRNGYYERSYSTRIGRLELTVPRTRDGEFSPTIFERYQRIEQALLSTILEMYVQGVSTRKVSKIGEELCGTMVFKPFISLLTSKIDEHVQSFLTRPL